MEVAILTKPGRAHGRRQRGGGGRGPNVIDGYENNPRRTLVLHNGWFRTGDLGILDAAGIYACSAGSRR